MANDETEIRALLEQRARAIHDKDAETAVSFYADGAVNFDLAPPLAMRGSEITNPENTRQWLATWKGPVGIQLSHVTVRVEGGLAWAWGFVHMTGDRTDGTHTDVWARSTVCLEKRGTGWKIVHEHTSFPMLMDGSEKAATNLKPEPSTRVASGG